MASVHARARGGRWKIKRRVCQSQQSRSVINVDLTAATLLINQSQFG